jgi:hypothetical protein
LVPFSTATGNYTHHANAHSAIAAKVLTAFPKAAADVVTSASERSATTPYIDSSPKCEDLLGMAANYQSQI